MKKELSEKIKKFVREEYGTCDSGGYLSCKLYAYDDELSGKKVNEILLSANDPMVAFEDYLFDAYLDATMEEEYQCLESVKEAIPELEDIDEDVLDENLIEEIRECIEFVPDFEHYLSQTYHVPIMLDTGDGNVDYTLNNIYPHYAGDKKEHIDERSSLLWLARQQGYKKSAFFKEMLHGDARVPKGFLQTCKQELANGGSQMQTVTFLVKITLKQLIELNRLIAMQDRNGHFYDTRKNPYCGYLVLDKKTMCGLYDPWSGAGSVLEIELEKDVRIPIRFIRSALVDGGDGYSVDSVYGLCGNAWKDTVKEIHAPRKA